MSIKKKHVAGHLRPTRGSVEFTCSESACGKQFSSATKLKRHEIMHKNELLNCYFCLWRGNPYKTVDIESHYALHAGHKMHRCDICGIEFTLKSNLKQHFEGTHERRDDRHKCKNCEFRTFCRRRLWDHHKICDKK